MSGQLAGLAVDGEVPVTDGTSAPDHYHNGLPFEADGSLAVANTGDITHHYNGLGFTAEGRIAVKGTGGGGGPQRPDGAPAVLDTADLWLHDLGLQGEDGQKPTVWTNAGEGGSDGDVVTFDDGVIVHVDATSGLKTLRKPTGPRAVARLQGVIEHQDAPHRYFIVARCDSDESPLRGPWISDLEHRYAGLMMSRQSDAGLFYTRWYTKPDDLVGNESQSENQNLVIECWMDADRHRWWRVDGTLYDQGTVASWQGEGYKLTGMFGSDELPSEYVDDGSLCEAAFFNTDIGDAAAAEITAYLQARWNP